MLKGISVGYLPVFSGILPLFDSFRSGIGKWYLKVVFGIFDCFQPPTPPATQRLDLGLDMEKRDG